MIYDRILTILQPAQTQTALTRRLVRAGATLCGEKTVSDTRFYMAQQAGVRIDKLVELWPAGVDADQLVELDNDGVVFRVVKSTIAWVDGLRVQTLTLRREEAEYAIVEESQYGSGSGAGNAGNGAGSDGNAGS